eukprot:TRINITY_DN4487_c0_g1_i2.p1 TRINITY_DN4487_c0_g1~~TRINITY_DN4487_c0_g1_i2.p1  ORF type:complete len:1316 (+),score=198.33 TRINITY_DN4487_c0_g1_i2:239-3949(+)
MDKVPAITSVASHDGDSSTDDFWSDAALGVAVENRSRPRSQSLQSNSIQRGSSLPNVLANEKPHNGGPSHHQLLRVASPPSSLKRKKGGLWGSVSRATSVKRLSANYSAQATSNSDQEPREITSEPTSTTSAPTPTITPSTTSTFTTTTTATTTTTTTRGGERNNGLAQKTAGKRSVGAEAALIVEPAIGSIDKQFSARDGAVGDDQTCSLYKGMSDGFNRMVSSKISASAPSSPVTSTTEIHNALVLSSSAVPNRKRRDTTSKHNQLSNSCVDGDADETESLSSIFFSHMGRGFVSMQENGISSDSECSEHEGTYNYEADREVEGECERALLSSSDTESTTDGEEDIDELEQTPSRLRVRTIAARPKEEPIVVHKGLKQSPEAPRHGAYVGGKKLGDGTQLLYKSMSAGSSDLLTRDTEPRVVIQEELLSESKKEQDDEAEKPDVQPIEPGSCSVDDKVDGLSSLVPIPEPPPPPPLEEFYFRERAHTCSPILEGRTRNKEPSKLMTWTGRKKRRPNTILEIGTPISCRPGADMATYFQEQRQNDGHGTVTYARKDFRTAIDEYKKREGVAKPESKTLSREIKKSPRTDSFVIGSPQPESFKKFTDLPTVINMWEIDCRIPSATSAANSTIIPPAPTTPPMPSPGAVKSAFKAPRLKHSSAPAGTVDDIRSLPKPHHDPAHSNAQRSRKLTPEQPPLATNNSNPPASDTHSPQTSRLHFHHHHHHRHPPAVQALPPSVFETKLLPGTFRRITDDSAVKRLVDQLLVQMESLDEHDGDPSDDSYIAGSNVFFRMMAQGASTMKEDELDERKKLIRLRKERLRLALQLFSEDVATADRDEDGTLIMYKKMEEGAKKVMVAETLASVFNTPDSHDSTSSSSADHEEESTEQPALPEKTEHMRATPFEGPSKLPMSPRSTAAFQFLTQVPVLRTNNIASSLPEEQTPAPASPQQLDEQIEVQNLDVPLASPLPSSASSSDSDDSSDGVASDLRRERLLILKELKEIEVSIDALMHRKRAVEERFRATFRPGRMEPQSDATGLDAALSVGNTNSLDVFVPESAETLITSEPIDVSTSVPVTLAVPPRPDSPTDLRGATTGVLGEKIPGSPSLIILRNAGLLKPVSQRWLVDSRGMPTALSFSTSSACISRPSETDMTTKPTAPQPTDDPAPPPVANPPQTATSNHQHQQTHMSAPRFTSVYLTPHHTTESSTVASPVPTPAPALTITPTSEPMASSPQPK